MTTEEFNITQMHDYAVFTGDCVENMRKLPEQSVQCVVTSPPYWGLRDYGVDGQIGLEKSPELYVARMVEVFREVKRVLRKDGTVWLNLGDSYAHSLRQSPNKAGDKQNTNRGSIRRGFAPISPSLKEKDLIGIPWRVAFALQQDGWYLRSDIIWAKPNPMPESVTDRPTKAHEYIFLLTRSAKYFYDAEAIKDPPSPDLIKQIEDGYNGRATKNFEYAMAQDASATKGRIINGYRKRIDKQRGHSRRHAGFNDRWDHLTTKEQAICGRNKRSVWTVPAANFSDAHFATYPPLLIRPCILAGSKPGDIVLDPFAGSGTTGQVAIELGRKAVLCELNPNYVQMIHDRCRVTPGLAL